MYFVNLNLIIKFQVNRKRRTWDNGRKHWPQTPFSLYLVQCLLLYVAFSVLREWVQTAITRNILQQYVRQSSKKYHSYIILWSYSILATILDIRWIAKLWLLPFLGTPIDHSLWKIFKIALKFSVITLL